MQILKSYCVAQERFTTLSNSVIKCLIFTKNSLHIFSQKGLNQEEILTINMEKVMGWDVALQLEHCMKKSV